MSFMSADPIVIVGGGQSGLAAARTVRDSGLRPIVLEAGERPVGSWPDYYDSLALFSPARYSAIPDPPFPGGDDGFTPAGMRSWTISRAMRPVSMSRFA